MQIWKREYRNVVEVGSLYLILKVVLLLSLINVRKEKEIKSLVVSLKIHWISYKNINKKDKNRRIFQNTVKPKRVPCITIIQKAN